MCRWQSSPSCSPQPRRPVRSGRSKSTVIMKSPAVESPRPPRRTNSDSKDRVPLPFQKPAKPSLDFGVDENDCGKELEQLKIPAATRMQHHDAYMNPKTHQMQQTVYLATANLGSETDDDMFKIVAQIAPEDVADIGAEETCKLESFEDTPVNEP